MFLLGLELENVLTEILDIDDYGSIIPLKDLELNVPTDDESVIRTLKTASYAAIFTEGQ